MIERVVITLAAQKDLRKVPKYIAQKFAAWVISVREVGLEQTRKVSGYRDESLHGKRKGQRSIRLSLAYRAIYQIGFDGTAEFVSVEEVNKHNY